MAVACEDRRVHQVRILTPDKDLGQCVSGRRVVQVDRRNNLVLDETAIRQKFVRVVGLSRLKRIRERLNYLTKNMHISARSQLSG